MNITYLLGAGASYQALPVMDELSDAFSYMSYYCSQTLYEHNSNQGNQADLATFQKAQSFLKSNFDSFKLNSEKFGTIDTYARKLALNEERQIYDLKCALSLFFCLFQEMGNKIDFSQKIQRKSTDVLKEFDNRYFQLLSKILQKENDKIFIPNNIKFITWNYDVQLERALQSFTNKNNLLEVFDENWIHPVSGNSTPSELLPSVIHLNGLAGFYKTENQGKLKSLFDKGNSPRPYNKVFNDLYPYIDSHIKETISFDECLSFAWERHNKTTNQAIDYAAKIMEKTDVLIVIGYSFPAFNSEIDKLLFDSFLKGLPTPNHKIIYYQDIKANKEIFQYRFNIQADKIFLKPQVEQFELPLHLL